MSFEKVLSWIAALSLAVGSFFLSLFTLVRVWHYVMVPLNLPEITKWQAYGVMILIHHLTVPQLLRYQEKEGKGPEVIAVFAIQTMFISLVSWGISAWLFG